MLDKFEQCGLVRIKDIDDSILIDLKYATTDNFLGKRLYPVAMDAYCEPGLAERLVAAQRDLKSFDNRLSLVVLDAARPVSVQREMFEHVRGTEREEYIANPYGEFGGGFHNFGMAIDVAIVDESKKMLDFGTEYDSFNETAHSDANAEMVKSGKLSIAAYKNRTLLYYVMGKNDMLPLCNEWWHFQREFSEESKRRYQLLDF